MLDIDCWKQKILLASIKVAVVTYLFLSLNLSAMNFPEQYRIIFLEKDPIINKYTHTRFPVVDYVNAIHIPSPKFIMSSSSNSVELIPGDKKIIEIRLKSINPSTIANVQAPNQFLSQE